MRIKRILLIIVLSLLLLSLFTWAGKEVVVNQRGTRVDFFAIWYGSNLTLHHSSPYSLDATLVIHENLSGRPLGPGVYIHSFAYPAYLAVVLFPIALLPYSTAFSIWTGLQFPMLFIALYFLARFMEIKLKPFEWAILFVAGTIGFRFPLYSYALGQISIFLLFLIALLLFFLKKGKLTEAGITLAITAIRPDIFCIAGVASIIFLWKSSQDIKRLILVTAASFIAINIVSIILLGFWYPDWFKMLLTYSGDNPKVHWPLEIFPTTLIQIGFLSLLIGYLLWQFFRVYREPRQENKLVTISTLFLVYALSLKVTGVYHMTLLLVPALILLSFYAQSNLKWVIWITLILPWFYKYIPINFNSNAWGDLFFTPLSFLILQVAYPMFAPKFAPTVKPEM